MRSDSSTSTKGAKVALVTGASHGIGRAVSLALGRSGYGVVLSARHAQDLAKAEKDLLKEGHRAVAVAADLSTKNGREKLARSVERRFGHLNVVVHCASARTDPEKEATLAATSVESIEAIVTTTVGGTFNLVRRIQPLLVKGRPSHLVLIASDWALRGSHGPPVFSAAKAAVGHFGHTLRKEFARSGISITTIYPGDVASFDQDWNVPKWHLDDPISEVKAELGDSRIALIDVAEAVQFVISRKLGRVEEIYMAPSNGEYDY